MHAAGQINYALQLHEARAGRLYLELPVMIAASSTGLVTPGAITAADTTTVFFTPGVRWHHAVTSRVASYGAIGGGIASLSGSYASIGSGVVNARTSRTTTGAFGFGGGIDVRLSRLVSLRAEGRDFVTRAGLGGERGRNHAFVTVGVGFHF